MHTRDGAGAKSGLDKAQAVTCDGDTRPSHASGETSWWPATAGPKVDSVEHPSSGPPTTLTPSRSIPNLRRVSCHDVNTSRGETPFTKSFLQINCTKGRLSRHCQQADEEKRDFEEI